jgi:hypothetical protein
MPDRSRSGIARYEFHRARIDLAERQLNSRLVRPGFQWEVIAYSLAARGMWDSALVASDSASRIPASAAARGLNGYRLAAIGAWLGAVDPSEATARRERAVLASERMAPANRAELAWVDGLMASTRGDAAALARAREALRRSRAPEAHHLDSSLAAIARELTGDRRRALELLLALERDRYGSSNVHPYLSGVHRLTVSRWLWAAGRPTEALRLLTWHETIGDPAPHSSHANAILAPFAYLARARIMDSLGQRDEARVLFARFLDNYDAPVQAHRRLVEEARAALRRMRRP